MTPDAREPPRRRKIALACEPCRDRKSRCDGGKPICSACRRRGLPLDQCLYKAENARTASTESYIKVLHERIRLLQDACTANGVPVPPLDPPGPATVRLPAPRSPEPGLRVTALRQGQGVAHTAPLPLNLHAISPSSLDTVDSPNATRDVTAMGTILNEDDGALENHTDEFYGSSSAASFIKLAYASTRGPEAGSSHHQAPAGVVVPSRTDAVGSPELHWTGHAEAHPGLGFLDYGRPEHWSLPPRSLADHLLERFWERVFCLWPFFHRPTFEHIYRQLWQSPTERQQQQGADEHSFPTGLGLGSSPGAGLHSIVFQGALNLVFAMGCLFSDLRPEDRPVMAQHFLIKSKFFISLDLLDSNNIGTVQCLLLAAIFLQSTSYPHRCWHSVGVACRIALGLGLHSEPGRVARGPLEREIRRRTWHGCVSLDMIVSMTLGRPAMTSSLLRSVPLPSPVEEGSCATDTSLHPTSDTTPSRLQFYVEHLRLCQNLGDILSRVYQSGGDKGRSSLDTVLELDSQLLEYEQSLGPFLSWTKPCSLEPFDGGLRHTIEIQRTVLHGRFLYSRLMLHRPVLIQVCVKADAENTSKVSLANSPLYDSCAIACANTCLKVAMELLDLVHKTYQTHATGGWWWDELYTCTAGLALLIVQLSPTLNDSLDPQILHRYWEICQQTIRDQATYSASARKSLKLLLTIHDDVVRFVDRGKTMLSDEAPANLHDGFTLDPSLVQDLSNFTALDGTLLDCDQLIDIFGEGGLQFDASAA